MKKIFGLIKRHKLLFLLCFLAIIIVMFLGYIFFDAFISGDGVYGDRLKGIEKVKISEKHKKEVEDFLEEKEEVTDASVRVQGKIIYINIKYQASVALNRAKEIANESLSKFDEDEKKFYDIGYSLTQEAKEGEEGNGGFVVTGSKGAIMDSISWIKS